MSFAECKVVTHGGGNTVDDKNSSKPTSSLLESELEGTLLVFKDISEKIIRRDKPQSLGFKRHYLATSRITRGAVNS